MPAHNNRRPRNEAIGRGIDLSRLPAGTVLSVETQNRRYRLEYLGDGTAKISGHPIFCPQPLDVDIVGSSWAGVAVIPDYIGEGMQLKFRDSSRERTTFTSVIAAIHTENAVQ